MRQVELDPIPAAKLDSLHDAQPKVAAATGKKVHYQVRGMALRDVGAGLLQRPS